LLRRLAVGGMGEIWVARNEGTGATVAVKVLRAAPDDALAARFRNEARLAARLSHRSIVRVFDWIEEPGEALALVMELLRGESLARYLERNGPLSSEHAVAILVPVLSALAHAHASGIIHRDIAPANIFLALDPDGHVTPKILDFGIAKLPTASTHTLEGQVLGTPRYMSPEQIRGEAELDGRSDLFGVGAVLYETITGASPFAAPTPAASLAAVLEHPVDPDPRIEPRVWLQIQRALAKRLYERSSSAAELADGLREAVHATDESLAALLKQVPPVVANDGRKGEEVPHTTTLAAHTPQPDVRTTAPRASTLRAYGRAAAIGLLAASAVLFLFVVRRSVVAGSPAATSDHIGAGQAGSRILEENGPERELVSAAAAPSGSVDVRTPDRREGADANTDVVPAPRPSDSGLPSASVAAESVSAEPSAPHRQPRWAAPRAKPVATTPGF
jgi:serine/threonine-protein kinase